MRYLFFYLECKGFLFLPSCHHVKCYSYLSVLYCLKMSKLIFYLFCSFSCSGNVLCGVGKDSHGKNVSGYFANICTLCFLQITANKSYLVVIMMVLKAYFNLD